MHVRALIKEIRNRFHPLFYARKTAWGRAAIRLADGPTWLSVPNIAFKVRGRRLTHGLAFAVTGSQEERPEALARVCMRELKLRSFWDVGANIGYYAWLMKSIAPDAEIVLFEPLPANAALIQATMARHRLSRTTCIPAAASDASGSGILHADQLAGATSSLEEQDQTFEELHWKVAASPLKVRLVSLDSIREQHDPVDSIKLDVEGHEQAALRGAGFIIARDQPILFIECCHPGQPCLAPLASLGYRIIDADRLASVPAPGSANWFCFPARWIADIDSLLQKARRQLA